MDDTKGDEEKGGAATDRRTLLRTAGIAGAAGAAFAGAMHGKFSLAPITAAQAQTAAMPKGVDKPWWPSKWGKDDEAGASNHITPAKVLDAVKWIKDGKMTKHGILNHENLIFDELIADKKYQFVYCFTPSPIKGATGSNGCPIAIT